MMQRPLTNRRSWRSTKMSLMVLANSHSSTTVDLDPNVKPVQNTRRRVAIPIRSRLKAMIEDTVAEKISARLTQPTAWISIVVVVAKPDKLRICLDPLHFNKAVKRNHYLLPTIDEVASRLTKATLFSVEDAKDCFLQVKLDEPSSYLTTMWTHMSPVTDG